LEGQSYVLKVRYNERSEQWFLDFYREDTTAIMLGVGIVPNYPIALDYAIAGLNGFFWLESIAELPTEDYKTYPEELYQYYRFFYIFEDGV
jgi:hypothetical protein